MPAGSSTTRTALRLCGALLLGLGATLASAQGAAPVKLGLLTALSGPYVPFGQPLADGVRMAVEEVNAQGGLEVKGQKHKVEIVERDTRSDVNAAVAGATALVRDAGVKYIIGPGTGIETGPALEITQRAKVIQMSAASILQGILTKENTSPTGNRRHLFMVQSGSDVREVLTIKTSARLFNNPKQQAVIISNDSNGDFIGKKVAEAIAASGASLAVPVVMYEPGTTDYSPYLTKIRQAKPDHLNIWWLPTDGINILQQARQLGVANSYFLYGPEPQDVVQRMPDVDRVLIACSPICRGITTTPETKAFWDRYAKLIGGQSKFGAAAGGAAWYYEGTRMLFKAMQAAGTIDDTDAIAAALKTTRIKGPLGDMHFNDRQIALHGIDFCVFNKGKPSCENVAP
jgi:ABC-type branched-subunit amino acid transport system substrate-binding protein